MMNNTVKEILEIQSLSELLKNFDNYIPSNSIGSNILWVCSEDEDIDYYNDKCLVVNNDVFLELRNANFCFIEHDGRFFYVLQNFAFRNNFDAYQIGYKIKLVDANFVNHRKHIIKRITLPQ